MSQLKQSLLANLWQNHSQAARARDCVEMPTSDRFEKFYGNIGNGHLGSCRV